MTTRFIALTGVLLICCASRMFAQTPADSPLLEWSADRALTIKDFKGKIPLRAAEASRSWVAIEASWECENGMGSWVARAVFDPNRSWWRELNQNIWQRSDGPPLLAPKDEGGRSLLAHEQLHFDLTELWARRVRELLRTLATACKAPGGAHDLEASVAAIERDWSEEQARYNKETSNGTDAFRQKAWEAKTAKALNEPGRALRE